MTIVFDAGEASAKACWPLMRRAKRTSSGLDGLSQFNELRRRESARPLNLSKVHAPPCLA